MPGAGRGRGREEIANERMMLEIPSVGISRFVSRSKYSGIRGIGFALANSKRLVFCYSI
jgi:hypothetical protein